MDIFEAYQEILREFQINDWQIIRNAWNEEHRFYHTPTHLEKLIIDIEKLRAEKQVDEEEYKVLLMSAFFHDVVYNPKKQGNEEKSALFFEKNTIVHKNTKLIRQIILDTATHQTQHQLSKLFSTLDMKIVTDSSFTELLAWEKNIAKEYRCFEYSVYKTVRLKLLEEFKTRYPQNATNLNLLIEHVKAHRPHIGIYAGSFNPFHNGHLNIVEKAEKIFDKIIIARGVNPEKQGQEKKKSMPKALEFRQYENFRGLLTSYLSQKEKDAEITLLRGLRNGDDLDYEVNQLRFMEEMKPDIKMVFIVCDSNFEHISSSAIRNLERIEEGLGKKYLPD